MIKALSEELEGGKLAICFKVLWGRTAKGTNTTGSRHTAFWQRFRSVTFGIFQFTTAVAHLITIIFLFFIFFYIFAKPFSCLRSLSSWSSCCLYVEA
jgi:hypothetical protein